MKDDHIASRPVFEWDQVMTREELYDIAADIFESYKRVPWWNIRVRWSLAGAFYATKAMVTYIDEGKPFSECHLGDGHEEIG